MKNFILITSMLLLLPTAAHADWHEYRGWVGGFPPPLFVPVPTPPCRDVRVPVQVTDGHNVWIVTETHTACLNQYGQWDIVR